MLALEMLLKSINSLAWKDFLLQLMRLQGHKSFTKNNKNFENSFYPYLYLSLNHKFWKAHFRFLSFLPFVLKQLVRTKISLAFCVQETLHFSQMAFFYFNGKQKMKPSDLVYFVRVSLIKRRFPGGRWKINMLPWINNFSWFSFYKKKIFRFPYELVNP